MHQSSTFLALAMTSLVIGACLARSLPDSAETRHRSRRALGTMTLIQKELELALGRHLPQGCSEIGCELLNPAIRQTRSSSDQRMAELQALIALSRSADGGVGHGAVDIFRAYVSGAPINGKKRRSYELTAEDGLQQEDDSERRLRMLQELLQRVQS